MSIEGITPPTTEPSEPKALLPPIASLWRRLAAWLVDALFLGIIGQLVGWPFSGFWFQVGPYGRIVGFIITLIYFGLLNSNIGSGQTIGKRLLRIAVRDAQNRSIGVRRSLLRILILALPALCNGWQLPILQSAPAVWLLGVIIFGLGGAIAYTMVFNRTRQGLHDLICATYVVYMPGKPIEAFPRTARIHWILSSCILVLAMVLGAIGLLIGTNLFSRTPLVSMNELRQVLQNDDRFFSVGATDSTLYSTEGAPVHLLEIQAWYRGLPSNEEQTEILNDIAEVVLLNTDNIEQYDGLRISVTSAFDLGIAKRYITHGDGQPIEVWRERVAPGASQ